MVRTVFQINFPPLKPERLSSVGLLLGHFYSLIIVIRNHFWSRNKNQIK